jgi:hypothetical protein
MEFGLDDKDIDSLREKCMLLRKKLKDSVLRISEYASMCVCHTEAERSFGKATDAKDEERNMEEK